MENLKKMTPIFVIGAMKAGTTTIYENLKSNTEICFPIKKEPSYFCEKMGNPNFKKDDYFNLFDIKETHRFFYDGSTNYTKYPSEKNVPKNIFEYGFRPKFIYVVRNPLHRIESHYNYTKSHPNWKKNKITADYLIYISNYYLQLKHFEKFFDKSDFMIVDFEELVKNQKTTMQQICQFIGVSYVKPPNVERHSNKTKKVNRTEVKLKKILVEILIFYQKTLKLS